MLVLTENKKSKIHRIAMKNTPLTLAFLLFASLSYSQTWFDLGVKGGYGLDLLYNQNFFNGRDFTPLLSYGYMYGGKVGFNFNTEHSITMDVNTSYFNQQFAYSFLNADSSRSNYTRGIGFNSLNFLPMYRKMKSSSYVEVGPQYSTVLKSRGTDSYLGGSDISPYIIKSYYSVVLGFGGFVMGTENFGITLGFRFSYTFNDLVTKNGQLINFPSTTPYATYNKNNPISALMVMEFNYDLGYLVNSKCGKKTKFLMF